LTEFISFFRLCVTYNDDTNFLYTTHIRPHVTMTIQVLKKYSVTLSHNSLNAKVKPRNSHRRPQCLNREANDPEFDLRSLSNLFDSTISHSLHISKYLMHLWFRCILAVYMFLHLIITSFIKLTMLESQPCWWFRSSYL